MKKNRILYLVLLILSLTFVYFYGGKIPYMLFYTALILPVISAVYTLVIFFRFKYVQETDKKFVVKGDKVSFTFNFVNEDFILYPFINVTFCGAEAIFSNQIQTRSFSVAPFRQKKYSFELTCNYRGSYNIGIKSVEIMDFLGIFKLSYSVPEPKYITVYPRIVPLDRFYLKTVFLSETNSVLNSWFKNSTTISDIKEYEYGDSLKKIHWKATAKTGKLMVKNFQNTSEACVSLFLDLRNNLYSFEQNTIIEDKVIESAVSVVHYCISNWMPVNLVYFDNGKIVNLEVKNPLDFEEIYKVFSKISFDEKVEIKDILDVYMQNSIDHTSMVIFTSNLDYDLYDKLYKIKSSGYDISLVYTSPAEITGITLNEADNILAYLPEIGINTYKLDISDDIKIVLER